VATGRDSREQRSARTIECVVFDVGGIILSHVRTWGEGHVRAGFDPDDPVLKSESFIAERARLALLHQRGEIESREYRDAVAGASDGAYGSDDVARILHAWLIEEYAGVGELVDDLLATEVAAASLSNTNAAHWGRVMGLDGDATEFPTTRRLAYHAPSHEVGAVKPSPKIYAALEATTGLKGPALLFFDDRQRNVDAARARGWHAELIDHESDPPSEMRAALRRYGVLA
jgi:FMN phosphatase YigB (HAD superfamily)